MKQMNISIRCSTVLHAHKYILVYVSSILDLDYIVSIRTQLYLMWFIVLQVRDQQLGIILADLQLTRHNQWQVWVVVGERHWSCNKWPYQCRNWRMILKLEISVQFSSISTSSCSDFFEKGHGEIVDACFYIFIFEGINDIENRRVYTHSSWKSVVKVQHSSWSVTEFSRNRMTFFP